MKLLKKFLSIILTVATIITSCSVVMPVLAANFADEKPDISDEADTANEIVSKIKNEVSELREESVKYFICEDGSFIAATYLTPVHYKSNDEWEEIDNTLKLTKSVKSDTGKSMYIPKSSVTDVKIPQSFADEQKISVANKGYEIKFGVSKNDTSNLNKSASVIKDFDKLPSARVLTDDTVTEEEKIDSTTKYNNKMMAVENQSGAVVYKNIFGDTDLEYIVSTDSIKENIVVNKKQGNYTYSFDMDFGDLLPVLQADNSIRLVAPDNSDETVFFISAPYMYDAVGVESDDIAVRLNKEGNKYVMTITADAKWINTSERVFPVVIDPTIYLSYNDVFVMNGVYANSTKVNAELRVGRNLSNLTRTYVKPAMPTNIPADSYINRADLILESKNLYYAPSASGLIAALYDCYNVNYWDPSNITWNNQPYEKSDNGYRQNNAVVIDAVPQFGNLGSSLGSADFIVTDAVERWITTGVNNGFMIASSSESTKAQMDYHSSRASSSSNYPLMRVIYTVPTVSISSWDTDSQAKESAPFTITTGSAWHAYSNAEWIRLEGAYGTGYRTNRVIVSENTSVNTRTGTVTVEVGDTVIGTISVTQYGADPYVRVDTTSLNYGVGQIKKTVEIESNTVWSFDNVPDWLTVTPASGTGDTSVEIESHVNNGPSTRSSNITVTADTASQTINVIQACDNTAPQAPNLYEEGGLVYISPTSFDFDENTDTVEWFEYKIDNGAWISYSGEPLSVIRTYDVPIYARTCDAAGNISNTVSYMLKCRLGEYSAYYTDIVLGTGILPIGFERTYNSTDGWFFTFDANIATYANGYVFTDLNGNKHYYTQNGEGKFVSVSGDELKAENGTIRGIAYSYSVPCGNLDCYLNVNGKLIAVKDRYNTATFSWTEDHLYITDEANNVNTITFANGKPISISVVRFDAATNTSYSKNVQYQWTNGNLTKFTDAANIEHNYSYTNDLLTTNDNETVVYSAENRVKRITQPNGAFVKYTYDDNATSSNAENSDNIGAVTVSDSKGVTDVWYYSDGFEISSEIDCYSDYAVYEPENISYAITTDSIARNVYIVDTLNHNTDNSDERPFYKRDNDGNYTFYEYDNNNNITRVLFVLADTLDVTSETTLSQVESVALKKITYFYDVNANLTEMIEYQREDDIFVNSNKNTYSYNNEGNILTQVAYEWLSEAWHQSREISFTYNVYGKIISQNINTYENKINPLTNVVETEASCVAETYEYDVWEQKIKVTKSLNGIENVSETEYDILGRVVVSVLDNKVNSYVYNSAGDIITFTSNEKITTYNYSENGNLNSVSNTDGAGVSYIYDNYGNVTERNCNDYIFTYNTLGSILSVSVGESQIANYVYEDSPEQKIVSSNFGNGQSVNSEYDSNGNITAVKLGSETKYEYEYCNITNENNIITKEWTELTDYVNNIKKITENGKITVNDLNENFLYSVEDVKKIPGNTNTFNGVSTVVGNKTYSLVTEENRDTFKINDTTAFVKEYEYENDELAETSIGGFSTEYTYRPGKIISALDLTFNGFSKNYSYSYDESNNIISETVISSNNITEIITYDYDDKMQLISAETSTKKYEYSYDNRGNILSKKEYSVTIDENNSKVYTLIEDETDNYVYDTSWQDKLISYNGHTITYDVVGNPINYMGNVLTWTMGRQLASFGNICYKYNEDGIRTSKTSGDVTTTYYINNDNVIAQTDGVNILYFYYDSKDELIGFNYNNNNYIYVKNACGDVVAITDCSGNIVSEYLYDPWGRVVSITGTLSNTVGSINPFRYRSYYYDTDTGMYYLQSRYYDPETCRFINSDDVNYYDFENYMFSYCNNNPINRIDKTGHEAITVTIVTTLIVALVTAFIVYSIVSALISNMVILQREALRDTFNDDIFAREHRTILFRRFIDTIAVATLVELNDVLEKTVTRIKSQLRTTERHHIVAKTAKATNLSRGIVEMHFGSINAEINLVDLKYGFHRVLHTKLYYRIVDSLIVTANGGEDGNDKPGVEKMLVLLRSALLAVDSTL